MNPLRVEKPVGDVLPDGSPSPNLFDDTLFAQHLLNNASGPGAPAVPLVTDGDCTPAVIAAIRAFQAQFGDFDGRLDPGDPALAALAQIDLPAFAGLTDRLEQRSVILRDQEWNFTRGDFRTVVNSGVALLFHPSSTWLPDPIKDRALALFNRLLDPAHAPAATWGVGMHDWFHCHLGVWSGTPGVAVSPAAAAWAAQALAVRLATDAMRAPFLVQGALPKANVAAYRAAVAARMAAPDVSLLLQTYIGLAEAVMVHHTFELPDWRPDMVTDDPRRHWMIDANGAIATAPYRTPADLNAAQERNEMICEGAIQLCFLIDKSGIVHSVLGGTAELCTIADRGSDELFP